MLSAIIPLAFHDSVHGPRGDGAKIVASSQSRRFVQAELISIAPRFLALIHTKFLDFGSSKQATNNMVLYPVLPSLAPTKILINNCMDFRVAETLFMKCIHKKS
jgi:hypothetical protein